MCPSYNGTECGGHGICDASSEICHCDNDYFGESCEIFCNSRATCFQRGYCTLNGTCSCDVPYVGAKCSEVNCSAVSYCDQCLQYNCSWCEDHNGCIDTFTNCSSVATHCPEHHTSVVGYIIVGSFVATGILGGVAAYGWCYFQKSRAKGGYARIPLQ